LRSGATLSRSLRDYAIYLLRKYGVRPSRRLGQTFLVDEGAIERIVDSAHLSERDLVLEIGGGLGFLTREIAERAGEVVTVEVDGRLVRALREVLRGFDNVRIVHGDALKVRLPAANKIVSNLPYSISTRVTFRLLDEVPFELAVLTYQREVAYRMMAGPGSPDYGRLTVMVQLRAELEEVLYIPKYSFYPVPRVDSVTLKMRRRAVDLSERELRLLSDVARCLFSQRNKLWPKVLRSCLLRSGVGEEAAEEAVRMCLEAVEVKRVRDLTVEDVVSITKALSQTLSLSSLSAS